MIAENFKALLYLLFPKQSRTFILGKNSEFVISIVVIRIELLIINDDSTWVYTEVVVRHQILYCSIITWIRIRRFHFQYTCAQRYILVHVVRLIIG